jgi:sulfoxide reductase heme-binding subunit YedZ
MNYNETIGSPAFRQLGHWAIRFLLLSLAMSPLYYFTGWRTALRLRKPAGLWAFAFVVLHVWFFLLDGFWGKAWFQSYSKIGLAAFIILMLLAATSHRFAMRLLGPNWKRLHRLVYIAGLLAVLHGLLAASDWMKIPNADANIWEMRLYCVLMVMLLTLRIPWVRTVLKRPPRKAKREPAFAPVMDT